MINNLKTENTNSGRATRTNAAQKSGLATVCPATLPWILVRNKGRVSIKSGEISLCLHIWPRISHDASLSDEMKGRASPSAAINSSVTTEFLFALLPMPGAVVWAKTVAKPTTSRRAGIKIREYIIQPLARRLFQVFSYFSGFCVKPVERNRGNVLAAPIESWNSVWGPTDEEPKAGSWRTLITHWRNRRGRRVRAPGRILSWRQHYKEYIYTLIT